MNPSECQVRRATIDDLKSLVALWESMGFPALELERNLTQFQVAEAPDGTLIGAVGLEMVGRHGRIHSEAFIDFSLADPLRQRLWERLHSVATNHGLTRVWTHETAPFWLHSGFNHADEAILKKLPQPWLKIQVKWFTNRLRDEEAIEMSLDKEFAQFKELEMESTARLLRQAHAWKVASTVIAIILAFLVIVGSAYILQHRSTLPGH